MNELTEWLGKKPHTKAMYLTAVATIVMAALTAVMCWTLVQNRESLRLMARSLSQNEEALSLTRQSLRQTDRALTTARDQLLASMKPSLHMSLSKEGMMTLTIENTGVPDLDDLRLYQIVYRFDTNNVLADRKIQGGPSFTHPHLAQGESITVSRKRYFDVQFVESIHASPTSPVHNLMSRVLCLAVLYRRHVDNQQFIHLEPTYPLVMNEGLGIGFLYQSDMTAWHSKGSQLEKQIQQINQRERLLFRIEE